MPLPMRMSMAQSPYDQRPVTTPLLRATDQGNPSAYPAPARMDVAEDPNNTMAAMQRRLNGGGLQQQREITGKSSDGKKLGDYISPRSNR